MILSLTINETLKWLSSLPILMQESFWWWQCSDRYIISLSPHLHTPFPPFSPSLISLLVSVDVKHHIYLLISTVRVQELCESRGSRPGLPLPNSSYGLCGRKDTLKKKIPEQPVPNSPYGLCRRKASLKKNDISRSGSYSKTKYTHTHKKKQNK